MRRKYCVPLHKSPTHPGVQKRHRMTGLFLDNMQEGSESRDWLALVNCFGGEAGLDQPVRPLHIELDKK